MDMNIELKEIHHYKSSSTSSIHNTRALASVISKAINKKEPSLNMIQDTDHLGIISTIHECYPHCYITTDLIEQLKCNEKFKNAMEYFTKITKYSHENITPRQLTQVKNSQNPFLSSTCHNLPLEIRQYILNSIRAHNHYSYSIKLRNQSPIKKVALCGNQHLAATYDDHKKINIWNLKEGTIISFLSKMRGVFSLAFNYRGTQLAVGCNNKNGEKTIKIFDSCFLDLLATIPSRSNDIEYITYPENGNDFQSSVLYGFDLNNQVMHTWFVGHNQYTYLGALPHCSLTKINNEIQSEDYTTNSISATRLSIKRNPIPFFFAHKHYNPFKMKKISK